MSEFVKTKTRLIIDVEINHMATTLATEAMQQDRENTMNHIEFWVGQKLKELQYVGRQAKNRTGMPFEFKTEWVENE